jgi:hypothetical protein
MVEILVDRSWSKAVKPSGFLCPPNFGVNTIMAGFEVLNPMLPQGLQITSFFEGRLGNLPHNLGYWRKNIDAVKRADLAGSIDVFLFEVWATGLKNIL